ncbi:hypothetical protein FSP39_018420 [Pinctada imbricata]|uniref:procollagen-proline 4-dioxygenase n=1 Tax=Pinctada imbricata TaxID=66713 RepID=A0AA88XQ12_PINIB|nr:hypothetical protein FSP39_018420 [Pinctada imbricata]
MFPSTNCLEDANEHRLPKVNHFFSVDISLEPTSRKRCFTSITRQINTKSIKDVHYCENPINAFHLLSRFVRGWSHVFDSIWCEDCDVDRYSVDFNLTRNVVEKHIGRWPSKIDMDGAANAIIRLWSFYQLDMNKLLNGQILDTQAEPLSIDDVIYITRYADDTKRYYEEIEWLKELLNRNDVQNNEHISIKVARFLAAAYYKYGMHSQAVEVLEAFSNSEHTGLIRDLRFYASRATDGSKDNKKALKPAAISREDRTYMALCRGDIMNSKKQSKLRCFNRDTRIPIYKSKEEVVNYFPRVSLFHDVIGEEHIQLLKQIGQKLFQRSMVKSENQVTYQEVSDNFRVSQTAWANETANPALQTLTRRVSLITGLDATYKDVMSHSEMYQVLNYGVGGMYNPHRDYLGYTLLTPPNPVETIDVQGTGERTATWMFYLSDVKAGGATVFPKLKARVPVVKGGAAFWYNMKLSGQVDSRTLHAGCPVLLGSKWASNKWIKESGQVLTRLCGLNIDDIEILPTK